MESTEKENSGKIPPSAFQNPRKKIKCSSLLIDLHGGRLRCKFLFPFDQLSKGNNVNPIIILNKMSFNCHEMSICSQLFLCSDLKNTRRKKIPSVSRARNLCSVLTVILARAQPLYRSWKMLLLLAVFLTDKCQLPYLLSPLSFHWPFVPWSWWCPRLCPWRKYSYCSHSMTTASKLQIKPPHWGTDMHRSCFPLITHYKFIFILLLYINPYFFFF